MEYKLYSDKALSAETPSCVIWVDQGYWAVSLGLESSVGEREGGRPAMKLNSSFCLVFRKLNSTFQDKCVLILK